jgi:DNA-directed RNA polymerase specialized sigma24 family protein/FixJ family two-component response regulator
MSANTAALAVHLPFMRRFARALTGSQTIGDNYALAALEAALAADPPLQEGQDVRVWLFRALLKVWLAIVSRHADAETAGPDAGGAADRHLHAVTPLPRAAFLLQSMEGLSVDRVAEVLDCSVAEAQALIDQAGRELAAQITTDVLIIEDELIISMDLQALVEELGHRVTHVARTREEAIAAAADHRPGLVLADIHLADDSSGLDAVNEIIATFEVPVVFITAYPEQVLTGTRPEPTFLITKPFRTETVKAVISQALFFDVRAHRSIDGDARERPEARTAPL